MIYLSAEDSNKLTFGPDKPAEGNQNIRIVEGYDLPEKTKPISGEIEFLINQNDLTKNNPDFYKQLFSALLLNDADAEIASALQTEGKLDESKIPYEKVKERFLRLIATLEKLDTDLPNQIADMHYRFAAIAALYYAEDKDKVVNGIKENIDGWQGKIPIKKLIELLPTDVDKTTKTFVDASLYQFKENLSSAKPEAVLKAIFGVDFHHTYNHYDQVRKEKPDLDVTAWTIKTGNSYQIDRVKAVMTLNAMRDKKILPPGTPEYKDFQAYLDRMVIGIQNNDPEALMVMQQLVDYWYRRDANPARTEMTGQLAKEEWMDMQESPLHYVTDTVKTIFDDYATGEERLAAAGLTTLGVMTLLGKGPFKSLRKPLMVGGGALAFDVMYAKFTGRGIFDRLGVTEAIRAAQGKESEVFRKDFLDHHKLNYDIHQFGLLQLENVAIEDILAYRNSFATDTSTSGNKKWLTSDTPPSIKRVQSTLGSRFELSPHQAGEVVNLLVEKMLIDVAESQSAYLSQVTTNEKAKIRKGEEYLMKYHKTHINGEPQTFGYVLEYYSGIYGKIVDDALIVDVGKWIADKTPVVPTIIKEQYYENEEDVKAFLNRQKDKGVDVFNKTVDYMKQGYQYYNDNGIEGIAQDIYEYQIGGKSVKIIWTDDLKPEVDGTIKPLAIDAADASVKMFALPFNLIAEGGRALLRFDIPEKIDYVSETVTGYVGKIAQTEYPALSFDLKADDIDKKVPADQPAEFWQDDLFGQYGEQMLNAMKEAKLNNADDNAYIKKGVGVYDDKITKNSDEIKTLENDIKSLSDLIAEREKEKPNAEDKTKFNEWKSDMRTLDQNLDFLRDQLEQAQKELDGAKEEKAKLARLLKRKIGIAFDTKENAHYVYAQEPIFIGTKPDGMPLSRPNAEAVEEAKKAALAAYEFYDSKTADKMPREAVENHLEEFELAEMEIKYNGLPYVAIALRIPTANTYRAEHTSTGSESRFPHTRETKTFEWLYEKQLQIHRDKTVTILEDIPLISSSGLLFKKDNETTVGKLIDNLSEDIDKYNKDELPDSAAKKSQEYHLNLEQLKNYDESLKAKFNREPDNFGKYFQNSFNKIMGKFAQLK